MKSVYLLLIFSAILYGSISTIAKLSLNTINPIVLSSLIYLIIGVSLTIIVKLKNNIANLSRDKLKLIFIDSACGAVVAPVLYFYGLKLTNASIASILINAEFLFSILFAISILKERPGKIAYTGIVFIFSGLIILNLKTDSSFFINNNWIGNMFIMGAAIFWALDNTISNILLKKETPIIRIIQIKSLIGGLLSFVIVFLLSISFSINDLYQIPILLFLSLGGFAGSLFLFLKGMKEIGTVKSVMIFSTSSVFGILFALIFLREGHVEGWRLLSSLILMMVGIFLITKNNCNDKNRKRK